MEKIDYMQLVNKIAEEIVTTIREIIDKDARYDISFKAKVIEIVNDGKYIISYHNKTYKASSSIPLNVGDGVWVCVPQSNWKDLFVVTKTTGRIV